MSMITIEVHEVGDRLNELLDAVLQGREVVVTHFGEVVARCRLHDPGQVAPRSWLETVMREGFDELRDHLRDHGDVRPFRLN